VKERGTKPGGLPPSAAVRPRDSENDMRPYKLPECIPADVLWDGIEWEEPVRKPISPQERRQLLARARRQEQHWNNQWRFEAVDKAARVARQIARDRGRAEDAAESSRIAQDLADSEAIARRYLDERNTA